MSSTPHDQNQDPNQEAKEEVKEEAKEEVKEEAKEEVKEEKKEGKTEIKKEEKKEEKKESWSDFIYNPRTGEFLGRTASSWGKTGSLETGDESADRPGSGAQRPACLSVCLRLTLCLADWMTVCLSDHEEASQTGSPSDPRLIHVELQDASPAVGTLMAGRTEQNRAGQCQGLCVCVCVCVCIMYYSRCGDINLFTQPHCGDSLLLWGQKIL